MSKFPIRVRVLLALAGWTAACGAALRTSHGPGATNASRALRAPQGRSLGEGVLLPEIVRPWQADSDIGSTNVVVGGMRATVRGEDVAWGVGRLAAPIVSAHRVSGGWVFIARDGTVAGSDNFLGALRRLGALTDVDQVRSSSRGRLVVVDPSGVVRTTEGREPLAPLRALPEGHVIDVVFTDAEHGAAITEGGQLYRTVNGGRAWLPVDLGPEAAWRMMADGQMFAVETTGGPRNVAIDGTVSPRSNALPAPPPEHGEAQQPVSAHDVSRVFVSLLERYPALVRTGARVLSQEGRLFTLNGNALSVLDPRSGRVLREVAVELPEACVVRAWSHHLAAACPGAEVPLTMLVFDGYVPLGGPAALSSVVLSDDGAHAIGVGRCGTEGTDAAGTDPSSQSVPMGLCALDTRAWRWRLLPFTGRRLRLLGMHGAHALFTMRRQDEADLGLYVLDVDRGTQQRLRLANALDPRDVRVRSANWAPDGTIVAVVTLRGRPADETEYDDDDEEGQSASRLLHPGERGAPSPGTYMLHGRPGAPLALRALPAGAESVGFVDALRGIAAGADVAHVWQSADGGVTWQRANLAITGASKAVEFRYVSNDEQGVPPVECASDGCVVGERVWYPALSARQDEGTVMAAREVVEPAAEAEVDDGGNGARAILMGRYGCSAPASPVTSLLRVRAPARRGSLHRLLVAAGANGVMDAWGERGRQFLQFRWRGADAQGPFDGATQAASAPVLQPERDTQPWRAPRYAFWGAARGGALLERCIDDGANSACQVLWATPNGSIAPIPGVTAFGANLRARVAVDGILPTANGGFVVLVSGQEPITHAMVDSVSVIGPDGRLLSQRSFAFSTMRVHALARYRGATGYAVAKVNDPRSFQFFPLDGGSGGSLPLPAIAEGEVNLCSAQSSTEAAELVVASPGYVPQLWVSGVGSIAPAATLEVGPRGTCLRAIQTWTPLRTNSSSSPAHNQRGVQLRVGNDGALAGYWDDGNVTQLLRCNRN